MNKTLKTIAWICLILGILGTAVDATALVVGQHFLSVRDASFTEMRQDKGNNKVNPDRTFCIAEDANNDGKPDGDCLQAQPQVMPGFAKQGLGRNPGQSGTPGYSRSRFDNNRFRHPAILLLFLFLAGPVLAIVGAVILLVNRSPETIASKDKKEDKAENKDAKKN